MRHQSLVTANPERGIQRTETFGNLGRDFEGVIAAVQDSVRNGNARGPEGQCVFGVERD
jgi:hypothetical protein